VRAEPRYVPSGTLTASACGGGRALVHRLIEAQAQLNPHALAATDHRTRLTYGELNRRANQLARALAAVGARPEELVAILADRSLEMLVAFLGILKSGAAAVLLDPSHPDARLRRIMDTIQPLALVTLERHRDRISKIPAIMLDSGWPAIRANRSENLEVAVHPDNLAYVVHTSGSTGEPKRVGVLHRSIMHSVWTHQIGHQITPEDRGAWLAPPGSSAAVGELWPYLSAGASVHAAQPGIMSDAECLRDWLIEYRITKTFLSMPLAEQMFALSWPEGCSLRLVTVGSDTVRQWANEMLPFEVAVSCGSAEANGVTSSLMPWKDRLTNRTATSADRSGLPPVGRPWPDVQIYLLDGQFRPVPPGDIGEMYIDSPELARGYLGAPAVTANRFVPNPFGSPSGRLYRTGDLALRRPDGHIVHCGRADNEIKIRGFRVSPAEIEVELLKLPGIRDAAVVAIEGRDRRLAAYIVGSTSQSAASLREYLSARLPAQMVPAMFVFIDRMPLTPNGKVDRNALPEPVWTPQTGSRTTAGELEARIATSFAEILTCGAVGADDNFFDLGGDSLSASRLARLLRISLQIQLPLRAVVRNPTPAALATYVRARYPAIEDG